MQPSQILVGRGGARDEQAGDEDRLRRAASRRVAERTAPIQNRKTRAPTGTVL